MINRKRLDFFFPKFKLIKNPIAEVWTLYTVGRILVFYHLLQIVKI